MFEIHITLFDSDSDADPDQISFRQQILKPFCQCFKHLSFKRVIMEHVAGQLRTVDLIVLIIFLTGFLVSIYTIVGGIEAVIWTDVVQSIVLTVGALVCAIFLLLNMPEGPGQLFEIANEHQKFSLGSISLSLREPTVWVVFVYGIFINLQNFGIDQNFVQRYITAKSDRDARFSVWLGGMLFIPIGALFCAALFIRS